jgi:hypothetical protein
VSSAAKLDASAQWPDWTGRDVAIMASGPSVKKDDVALLRDRLTVFAIKKNVELAPFAEAVYGCDYPWWRSVHGLKDFKGWKFAYADRAVNQFGLRKIDIDLKQDRLLWDRVGLTGAGGNSGFHALNLAAQFGARRILLLGFDCQDRSGAHWYGRNTAQGMGNPGENNFRRWIPAFATAAQQLEERGVEVINASQITAVKGFPKISVAETLERWGLA